MEELRAILEDLRPDLDFEQEKQLIDDGLLDSFDIMSLVGSLNDEFDIRIKPSDLVPENFNSIEAIFELVETLQDE